MFTQLIRVKLRYYVVQGVLTLYLLGISLTLSSNQLLNFPFEMANRKVFLRHSCMFPVQNATANSVECRSRPAPPPNHQDSDAASPHLAASIEQGRTGT